MKSVLKCHSGVPVEPLNTWPAALNGLKHWGELRPLSLWARAGTWALKDLSQACGISRLRVVVIRVDVHLAAPPPTEKNETLRIDLQLWDLGALRRRLNQITPAVPEGYCLIFRACEVQLPCMDGWDSHEWFFNQATRPYQQMNFNTKHWMTCNKKSSRNKV